MIESLTTEIFKEFGKSDKTVFTVTEFETLSTKFPKLNLLKEKLTEKQSLESQLSSFESRKTSSLAQLTDIGTLPVDQPVALAERYGWVQLKKQKDEVDSQLASVEASIVSTTASFATVSAEVTALKTEMGVI